MTDLFGDVDVPTQPDLDKIAEASAASGQARYERDKAAARLSDEDERPDAHADLGYSHGRDGSLSAGMQAMGDAEEAYVAELKRAQPKPWDLSSEQLATNESGGDKGRTSLEDAGVTSKQRHDAIVESQLSEVAQRRRREAEVADAAKLVGGRMRAEDEAEAATSQTDDGPRPIEGAINTTQHASKVVARLAEEKRQRDAG